MGFLLGCTGSSLLCQAFSSYSELEATFHCSAQASHYSGFSCSGAQALGHTGFSSWSLMAQEPGLAAVVFLVAPCHVESSQTRDSSHVPCTGRRILIHWSTREVPLYYFSICSLWAFYCWWKIVLHPMFLHGNNFLKTQYSPSTDANFTSERKKGWKVLGFFLGYNHPQGCGTMVRCSECKASQSDFTTGWSWTSQLVFLSLSFLIYEMNLK